jgi:hypothetical protein
MTHWFFQYQDCVSLSFVGEDTADGDFVVILVGVEAGVEIYLPIALQN